MILGAVGVASFLKRVRNEAAGRSLFWMALVFVAGVIFGRRRDR